MDVYASEQEQIEALKKWWRENALALITGAVIGLGGLFGWQYWQKHVDERGAEASAQYEAIYVAAQAGRHDEVLEQGKVVVGQYADTPYAALSALMMARAHVEQGDLGAAEEQLRWVLANGDTDELRHVARIRLARVLLEQGEHAAVQALLQGVEFGTFASDYHEIQGDLALADGDARTARDAYRKALGGNPANSALIQLKLDDLGLAADEAIR